MSCYLHEVQSLPFPLKFELTKNRIKGWYKYWSGKVYVSFSGGKDSTVLLSIVRRLYPDVVAVFVDTGLEYPEVRKFVQTIDNVRWIKSKLSFVEVIEKWGYPVVSKEVAQKIYEIRNTRSDKLRKSRLETSGPKGLPKKWMYLLDAPFKISHHCCRIMKKSPCISFERHSNLVPFVGMMAANSWLRYTRFLTKGCNVFGGKRPTSNPISFWTEDDIWEYVHQYNIEYSNIYDMGYNTTGCVFCGFGAHLEEAKFGMNRFQLLNKTHPKLWKYCMDKLGMKEVLEYTGVSIN
ncbi:hypothetical protein LCGC14_1992660 [marine sediment metagenome]|uniref:Phosphoadenosine phosphosulphate reductase domain-containing protein n=1 Tax=marine sediment metagenome TaxID=412755 RepID=A0A0F9F5S5_9ZZZZ